MPASHIQVQPDGTGKDVDADAVTSTEGGTPTVYRQDIVVADPVSYASKARVFAPGQLRVALDPTQLFLDTFDSSLDTVNRWTAPTNSGTGSIVATWSPGSVLLTGGTAANAYSELHSQPVFIPDEPGWDLVSYRVNLEFPITTTGYRFWGLGTSPGSPTIAAPMTNGVGWDVTTGGVLRAVTYASGSAPTVVGTVTPPGDASAHKYYIFFRPDYTYWCYDSYDNVVASYATGASGPDVNTLPLKILAVSNSGTAQTIQVNAVSVGDTARNNVTISDPTYGWRQASVGKSGGLGVRGTLPAIQTMNVTAATPVTGAGLDVSEAGNVTVIVKNTVAATAFTGVPVIVYEQSDDNVSWAPLPVTSVSGGTSTAPVTATGGANVEQMFDAAVEGVNWVRARVTTAQAANGMTIVIQPGGMPFSPAVTAINTAANITGSGAASVASAASDTLILAANANRRGAAVFNDSTAVLSLSLGTTAASSTVFTVKIASQGYYEIPFGYAGQIRGIWASANGFARVTEVVS